jgi:predicted transcriptional regulator
MGFSDIQVQAQNMVLRHQDGFLLVSKYDPNNLDKMAGLLESKLAEYVGKPNGLPEGFDPKAFTALLSLALLNDIRVQAERVQEATKQNERLTDSMLKEINDLKEENADISLKKWQDELIRRYNNLKDVVKDKLPKIWLGLEFGLSVLRILNIDDCTLPLIAILLGRSGCGKTVPITLLSKWPYGYYTDDFSPKAWITHTTSVNSPEQLAAIDMLPRIKDHQFLTPELATLFNLKEEDLRVALAKITRIADGHGFASDSGVYGHRAYGDTMFTWLAAVVDISNHAYRVMAHLGPKLYFMRLPYNEISPEDLLNNLKDPEKFNKKYKAIEEALLDYLKWFEIGPTLMMRIPTSRHLREIQWDSSKDDPKALEYIVNLSILLGYLRCEGIGHTRESTIILSGSDPDSDENEQGYAYIAGSMEDVTRASEVLRNIARGHALITGFNYMREEDISIVAKVVLSTARVERVKALIALINNDGWITKKELSVRIGFSLSKAYRLMIELKAIGLVDIEETNDVEFTGNYNPAKIKIMRLKKIFAWFLTDKFKELRGDFTPVDNRRYIQEVDSEKEAAKAAASSTATAASTESTSNSDSNPNSILISNSNDDANNKKKENEEKLRAYEIARTSAAKTNRKINSQITANKNGNNKSKKRKKSW